MFFYFFPIPVLSDMRDFGYEKSGYDSLCSVLKLNDDEVLVFWYTLCKRVLSLLFIQFNGYIISYCLPMHLNLLYTSYMFL